ncbi:glucose-1-phosphate adenylyltransferase [Paenibacillus eucommiae]|nr:glucose-1-phosphate adenylyltransferase [Paenibacillus eucommiae]
MSKKECMAMLLAGGEGRRLHPLTLHTAKPAVHFGGSYRMIDFALSNCSNSGIHTIGVVTQYKPDALHKHIGRGSSWVNRSSKGEVALLHPADKDNVYAGTADAIYQNRTFINRHDPEYVLILSADHIYRMDYQAMLEQHKRNKADVTVAVTPVKWEEASRFGILSTDEEGRISRFCEKPAEPESNLASMGIYIFNWKYLESLLIKDKNAADSSHDFGKDLLPAIIEQGANIYAYSFKGYWRDVGTIESLWQANMDMLLNSELLPWQDQQAKVYTACTDQAPKYIQSSPRVKRSVVSDRCAVRGKVERSVISFGVQIGEGSMIEDSVIMPGVTIGRNAVIKKAIIGEGTYVGDEVIIQGTGRNDIAVIGEKETIVTKMDKPAARFFSTDWMRWISSPS